MGKTIESKRIRYLFLTILASVCFSFTTNAQKKAIVKGVITEVKTKEVLPGATVSVEGTTNGTSTDLEGRYSLVVKEGKIKIKVSYLGSKTKVVEITVKAGETKTLNVALEEDAKLLKEVVITSTITGQRRALNQQKSADNVKSIISADVMGKFPDQNSAESLQRVSGVNLQRDEGDGRFILVRGLAPQFTNISINGEQIPSPEGDSRFVALDAIPSNQLASLEVSKSITPDMDGDAIGGSVNLNTPTATKRKLTVNGSAAFEYNDGSGKTTGLTSVSISKRTKDGKFGYIVNGSYSKSLKASDRFEFDAWGDLGSNDIGQIEISDFEISRERLGASTTFDYRGKNTNLYFRTLFSELREVEKRRRINLQMEEDEDDFGNPFTAYSYTKELKDRPENQGVFSLNLGGNTTTTKMRMDYEFSFSKAWQDTPRNDNFVFENEGSPFEFNLTNRLSPRLINLGGVSAANNPFTDLSLLEFKEFEDESTRADDTNITFKTNFAFPFKLKQNSGELKFGGKVRLKDKDFDVRRFDVYEYDGSETLTLDRAGFNDGYSNTSFMNGEFNSNLGGFPSRAGITSFINNNFSSFERDDVKSIEEISSQEYKVSEDVYAAYLMGKVQFKKLLLLGGFRYESTRFQYESGIFNEEEETVTDIAGKSNYDFLLPMLHLKYNLSKNAILRASATQSYSRPNFEDLAQGAVFNTADLEASISNPDLVPVEAVNLDVFGEYYFGTVGLFNGGVFYKRLNNFIYQQTTNRTFRGVDNVEVTQAVNGDTASLFGFEIGYQQKLSFLPGFLKNFVLYTNYTYTDSNAKVNNFAADDSVTEIVLPGQAKHIGNAALGYSKGGFDARLSLNFNGAFTSEFDNGDAIRIDDRLQVDFSMSQTFYKNRMTVYLELVNINDENQIELYNIRATPKERQQFGSWGRLGLRFNF